MLPSIRLSRTRSAARLLAVLVAAALLPHGAAAQQSNEELARQATDPTAPLLAINLINDFQSSFYDTDDSGYEFRFQPVIPYTAWGFDNILRLIVPYQIGGPGNEGLKNVNIFDLIVLPQDWGRAGFGPVANLTQSDSETASKFSIGPAFGAVAQLSPTWAVGLFNQNLFGNDVAISQFQPIVAYQLGDGWSLSAGDMQIIYDWDAGQFAAIPLSFQIGVVKPVIGQPMRFSLNPQWNIRNIPGANKTKIIFSVAILAPTGG